MGNLMLVMVIAVLLRDSQSDDSENKKSFKTLRDKENNKKSIELTLISDDKNGDTSKNDVNRLIINSTYDDSVFISTSLDSRFNVTIVQDHQNIEVVKRNGTSHVDESFEELKSKTNELLNGNKFKGEKLIEKIKDLLKNVEQLQAKLDSKESPKSYRLQQLQSDLIGFLNEVQNITRDAKLEQLLIEIQENLVSDVSESMLEALDTSVEFVKQLLETTANKDLKDFAIKVLKDYEETKEKIKMSSLDILEFLNNIATHIRKDYYTHANISDLFKFREVLRELQPTSESEVNLVTELMQEISELLKAIDVITIAENKNEKQYLHNDIEFKELKTSLENVERISKNEKFKQIAQSFTDKMKNFQDEKEIQNFLQLLATINQTLLNGNNFGGEKGLQLIEGKLNEVLANTNNMEIETKATLFMQRVKAYQKKINNTLKLFKKLLEQTWFPTNEQEVNEYISIIENIKIIVREANDPSVKLVSLELISKIQKVIDEYKIKDQIDSINSMLQKMNETLEGDGSEEDFSEKTRDLQIFQDKLLNLQSKVKGRTLKKNLKDTMFDIEEMKRKIPKKSKELSLRKDAEKLCKIINEYIKRVMPEIGKVIRKAVDTFKKFVDSTDNRENINPSIKDRIHTASNDYERINYALKSIKDDLKAFNFEDSEVSDDDLEFYSTEDMEKRLLELKFINEDSSTSNLIKRTLAIVHNVHQANETLHQLQRMFEFNTKLLETSDNAKTSDNVETPYKPAVVAVKKISLYPLMSNEPGKALLVKKTATEASDLDNTAQDAVQNQ
jgi:hypothetical protein